MTDVPVLSSLFVCFLIYQYINKILPFCSSYPIEQPHFVTLYLPYIKAVARSQMGCLFTDIHKSILPLDMITIVIRYDNDWNQKRKWLIRKNIYWKWRERLVLMFIWTNMQVHWTSEFINIIGTCLYIRVTPSQVFVQPQGWLVLTKCV